MKFQVPQFIEVEDKIFGPLTLRQFIYLLGGGALIFLLYVFIPFIFFILLAIPLAIFFVALAFYRVANQPFIKVVEHAFYHYTRPKIFTWKKEAQTIRQTGQKILPPGKNLSETGKLTERKLEELAWTLDIKKKLIKKQD